MLAAAVAIALAAAPGCSGRAVAPRVDASGVGVLVPPASATSSSDAPAPSGAPPTAVAEDPGPVVAWLGVFDAQDPAIVARDDAWLGPYLRTAIERWPGVWQFHEHLAAHEFRAGNLAAARAEHAEARRLYLEAPLYDDPWLGWRGKFAIVGIGNTIAGPVGWLLGKGIVAAVDAAAGDVPVPFPDEPSAVAWSPPPTAHPMPGR